MTRKQQLAVVRTIRLVGGHHRGNCPFCGGTNTFSVSRLYGQLVWNCHRTSCDAYGRSEEGRTKEEILCTLKTKKDDYTFHVPEHFVNVLSNTDAARYLSNNNCIEAYRNRLADIRYDPRMHRVAFVCKDDTGPVGAVGRALTAGVTPKWYRYDKNQIPFTCGRRDDTLGILVEDAASACAVSSIATGIALMGTALTAEHISTIRKYSKIVVALDPDATRKALDMHREICYYTDCCVRRIPDDLKYFNSEQIREILQL